MKSISLASVAVLLVLSAISAQAAVRCDPVKSGEWRGVKVSVTESMLAETVWFLADSETRDRAGSICRAVLSSTACQTAPRTAGDSATYSILDSEALDQGGSAGILKRGPNTDLRLPARGYFAFFSDCQNVRADFALSEMKKFKGARSNGQLRASMVRY